MAGNYYFIGLINIILIMYMISMTLMDTGGH